MVHSPAFTPELYMYSLAAITDPGFSDLPDPHGQHQVITARTVVINRATHGDGLAGATNAYPVSVKQKMDNFTLTSRL